MRITMTLSEICRECNDWDKFCNDFQYDPYVINEGGGHIEVNLTKDQAKEYGVI